MEVIYKCRCMQAEVKLTVPDRRPLGDLMEWTGAVQHFIGVDHHALSPRCHVITMDYVKIPFDEASGSVGVKPALQ